VRVIVVDDHLAVAEMLRDVVEALPGFVFAGAARSGAEAVALCRRAQPDIVLLDLGLGRESGLAVLPRFAPARVIVFSGREGAAPVRRALAAGAHGFVDKQATLDELHAALRAVGSGATHFSPAAQARLGGPRPRTVKLSGRDRAVLAGLAEGLSSKEIAARLGLTAHTVNNVRQRLMRRANLRGTAQLARYAVSLGLVSEDVDGAAEPL
jgi:DNA-binding NarL/FixJ family response regulator